MTKMVGECFTFSGPQDIGCKTARRSWSLPKTQYADLQLLCDAILIAPGLT
jgi:hypothetical protein